MKLNVTIRVSGPVASGKTTLLQDVGRFLGEEIGDVRVVGSSCRAEGTMEEMEEVQFSVTSPRFRQSCIRDNG